MLSNEKKKKKKTTVNKLNRNIFPISIHTTYSAHTVCCDTSSWSISTELLITVIVCMVRHMTTGEHMCFTLISDELLYYGKQITTNTHKHQDFSRYLQHDGGFKNVSSKTTVRFLSLTILIVVYSPEQLDILTTLTSERLV